MNEQKATRRKKIYMLCVDWYVCALHREFRYLVACSLFYSSSARGAPVSVCSVYYFSFLFVQVYSTRRPNYLSRRVSPHAHARLLRDGCSATQRFISTRKKKKREFLPRRTSSSSYTACTAIVLRLVELIFTE